MYKFSSKQTTIQIFYESPKYDNVNKIRLWVSYSGILFVFFILGDYVIHLSYVILSILEVFYKKLYNYLYFCKI